MGMCIYYKLRGSSIQHIVKIDESLWFTGYGMNTCAVDPKNVLDEHSKLLWERYIEVNDYEQLRDMIDHWDDIDQESLEVC
jgi:hypothetical protein